MKKSPEQLEREAAQRKFYAARLVEARGEMTQADLVKLLKEAGHEIDQSRMSHYERGRNYPDFPDMAAIVTALGISADWWLNLTTHTEPVAELVEQRDAAKGEHQINKILKQLPKDKQQQVIDFAEFLLSQEKEIAEPGELNEWIAVTEVMMRRYGANGDDSFASVLASERPELAAALGIPTKKKSIQDR